MTTASSSKQQQLNDLEQAILTQSVCPELAGAATNLVFGDGDINADILFIGEAPGKNEDIQAKPFAGAAGKLLNEMLETIGLSRGQVYITNIVKYRPPNNRDPHPDEKKAFLPYLAKQIKIIHPKLIVTLGRHSMECFLPGLTISQVHGQPKRITWEYFHRIVGLTEKTDDAATTMVVLPLFHPAAALYNGRLRTVLFDDFLKIPSVLSKIMNESKK